jgi:hypothetical protein
MHKARLLAIALVAISVSAAFAQSPSEGKIAGNAYTNKYFHLTYTWPAALKPQPIPAADAKTMGSYEFLLFSAKQGDQPFGIAVVAQKLNVAGPHSDGVKSPAELLDRMHRSLRPNSILTNISRSQKKAPGGAVFEQLDYTVNGKPSTVLATQSGQYALLFKCSAQNTADLATLQKSVLSARLTQ